MKKILGEYVGSSRAVVLDNRDPDFRGRILIQHPYISDKMWVDYINSPSTVDVPEVGDVVYVDCEVLDNESPVARGKFIRNKDSTLLKPIKFQREVPTNRGIESTGGHSIEVDDGIYIPTDSAELNEITTEEKGIRITTSAGNKIHIREDEGFRKDGTTVESEIKQFILIEDVNGNQIKLDYKDNKITILSKGTHETTTTTDRSDLVGGNYNETTNGNKIEDVDGNRVENVDGNKVQNVGGDHFDTVEANRLDTIKGRLTVNVVGDILIDGQGKIDINVTGDANITSGGNTVVTAAEVQLNGTAGDVLTNTTDPVVDTIFGTPTIGVTTVKSG